MRTNIEIDDMLMEEAFLGCGLSTKREVVELGLKTLVRLQRQAEVRQYRGKLLLTGDLDAMRRDD